MPPDVFFMSSLCWPAWETSCFCSISMQVSHFTSQRALQRCSWEGCMSNQSGKRQSAKREKVESSKTTGGAENATGLKEQWQNRIVCMESRKSTLHDFFRIHWRLKVAEQQIVSVFPFTANPYRRLISLWNRDGSWHNFSSLALFFFLSPFFVHTLPLHLSSP